MNRTIRTLLALLAVLALVSGSAAGSFGSGYAARAHNDDPFSTEDPMIHPLVLSDASSGVSITTSMYELAVSLETSLSVSQLSAEAAAEFSIGVLGDAYKCYKIELVEATDQITPSDSVVISVPIPVGYPASSTLLCHIDENNILSEVPAEISDRKFICTASKLGYYAVVNTSIIRMSGDVNNDKKINIIDSTILRRHLAGWKGVVINRTNANVNGDTKIDSVDSIILRRYLAKWSGVILR